MIYVTGDTHRSLDIQKIYNKNFPQQYQLTKKDYLIICGDFGSIWDDSTIDKDMHRFYKNKNFTTLFVDGNHENFNLLNQYPVTEWNGGKVHKINDSIIHLMRGQVFTINKKKIFTMGGASSIDKHNRIEGVSWWREELPSHQEYEEALNNLEKHDRKVDYIITHTCANSIISDLVSVVEHNSLHTFFEMIKETVEYKHWYFGHFHTDKQIDPKHTTLYDAIVHIDSKKI